MIGADLPPAAPALRVRVPRPDGARHPPPQRRSSRREVRSYHAPPPRGAQRRMTGRVLGKASGGSRRVEAQGRLAGPGPRPVDLRLREMVGLVATSPANRVAHAGAQHQVRVSRSAPAGSAPPRSAPAEWAIHRSGAL